MLSRTDLFRSDLVRVRHVACRAECGPAGDIEYPVGDSIVLPVRGLFALHASPASHVLAEPVHALLFAEDRPYRVSHPGRDGDDCVVLEFMPAVLREAAAAAAGADAFGDARLRTHALLSPAACITRDVLHRRLRAGAMDPLDVEEVALVLLHATVSAARSEGGSVTTAVRARTRARRSEQVVSVRLQLLGDPGTDCGLDQLARRACVTPYHLARIFREEVGTSIHQYRLRIRVAAAIPRLLDTDAPPARIAVELGFTSQSHFTEAFRRLTGYTPARLRRTANRARVSHLSRILISCAEAAH